MKHSSSTHFSGIPIDTNTLAGQWMTFSHMANHYRKLLNVKPRIDTGLPANQAIPHHGSFHNFSNLNSSSRMQSSKSVKNMGSANTKSSSATNAKISTNGKSPCYRPIRRDNIMYSSHPEHLNISGKPSPAFLTAKESIGKAKKVIESSKNMEKSKTTKNQQNHHHPNPVLNYHEYQVVFGPSSIRSSTDAFMSDETDSTLSGDKPPSEVQTPVRVSDKIRHFINNIHHLDLKSSNSKKKKAKRVTTDPTTNKSRQSERPTIVSPLTPNSVPPSVVSSSTNQIDFRLSRHSRCFLPYEPNNNTASSQTKSPRKCQNQKGGTTTVATPMKCRKPITINTSHEPAVHKEKHLSSPMLSLNRKQGKSKLTGGDVEDIQSKKSTRLSRNKFTGSGMDIHMLPEKDTSASTKKIKMRKRAGSIASIGTICGSEELTPEDFPLSIQDLYSTVENGCIGDDILLSKILDDNLNLMTRSKKSGTKLTNHHHHHHYHTNMNHSSGVSSVSTNLLKSNSMASLVPDGGRSSGGTNSGRSKPSSSGVANNKDSSRDSAYGFSSGESRITTRESTPEKKCLEFESGTIHRQHSDLQRRPCKESSSRHKIKQKRSVDDIELKRKNSSERYIGFLAELTQDIVSKGIYTNKGLKTLFKAQLEQNKELNQDKLMDMLERLRTDLGIPKDDALDKIEFGYGSISNATSTTFFYTPPAPLDKLSTGSVIHSANTLAGSSTSASMKHDGILLEEFTVPVSAPSSTSHSPTTIIPGVPNNASNSNTTTTGFCSSGGANTSSARSTTTNTTDEGSGDIMSVPESDDNHGNNIQDEEEDDEEDEDLEDEFYKDEDVLSLSETEVTQALKIAGLNDAIAEEVVGMLKS